MDQANQRLSNRHEQGAGREPHLLPAPVQMHGHVGTERSLPSQPRLLSSGEMGAIIGHAWGDPPILRWILLQLATAATPGQALKLNVSQQFMPERSLLDLQTPEGRLTKRRSLIVPVIPQFEPWLLAHQANFVSGSATEMKSMSQRWRRMRRELGFHSDVVPRAIRTTVAHGIGTRGCQIRHISVLLGVRAPWQGRILATDQDLRAIRALLSDIWSEAWGAAEVWRQQRSMQHENTSLPATVSARDVRTTWQIRRIPNDSGFRE